MDIEWYKYKTLISPYFKRMFNNYIPLEKFENKNVLTLDIDMWNEDNFAVAYLCKGLDGYMKMYQKQYYGLYNLNSKSRFTYDRCECGRLYKKNSNRQKYCIHCQVEKQRLQSKQYQRKIRNHKV